MLLAAAIVIALTALAHSILGERYILTRLFRRPLPKLFGSDEFTRQTLRFAWHLTTVTWLGIAWLLVDLYRGEFSADRTLSALAATTGACGLITFGATRGKHLAWVAFAVVALLCWLSRGSL